MRAGLSPERAALSIGNLVHDHHDEVEEAPKSASAERKELGDAEPSVTQIETINAKSAEKEGEEGNRSPVAV